MRNALLVALVLLLGACTLGEAPVRVVTATPDPATATPTATITPLPTNTPRPSPSPTATTVPVPTLEPVPISQIEAALRADGYRRFPFSGSGGLSGYTWVKGSSYERIETWNDGSISLEVLHDPSADVRAEHMERKFDVLATVFPESFMAALRESHEEYNRTVGAGVSGEPEEVYSYGDEWQTVWGEYNVSDREIMGYVVRFSLWWWQSTCPARYDYCYYEDFPGLEFSGDSSFVFHTILLWPLAGPAPDGPST